MLRRAARQEVAGALEPRNDQEGTFPMALPGFVRPVQSAVSGRLLRLGAPGTGDPTTPAVLEAHLLPGLIGSSVYVLGAVGPSDTSWPYFPLGGAVMTDHTEMRVLEQEDDIFYWFVPGDTFGWEDEDVDHEQIESPEDLIDRVLAYGAEALGLRPWDASQVAGFLDACEGYDHFDEFMALPEADLPG